MSLLAGSSPRARRRLWLVRHGQSDWNARGLVQGHRDEPQLTPNGVLQARACAEALAGEHVCAIYSSDLRRALQTAAPIGEVLRLDVAKDARLRERALGDAEATPSARLGSDVSGIAAGRVLDADAAPDGGESVRALYARVAAFAAEVLAAPLDGDVVLVCHGGTVRVLLALLAGAGPDGMPWPEIANALPICRPVGVPTGADTRSVRSQLQTMEAP